MIQNIRSYSNTPLREQCGVGGGLEIVRLEEALSTFSICSPLGRRRYCWCKHVSHIRTSSIDATLL